MKRYTLVEVTWVDSDHSSQWTLVSDLDHKMELPMLCKSVGYFLAESAHTFDIVQSHSYVGHPDEQIDGRLRIPKVAIKRKRTIR